MKQNKPNLNRIVLFKQVADLGSFSKASKLLQLPKSNVSRNISTLEAELGTQLIYRTTRQFQLTQAGKDFYENTRKALLILDSAVEQIDAHTQNLSGNIRITAPEDLGTALLGEICSEFISTHKQIKIDILLTNEVLDLVKNSIDIAVRVGTLKDSGLIKRTIGRANLVLMASTQFANRYSKSLHSTNGISQVPTLAFSPLKPTNVWTLRSINETVRVPINPVISSDNLALIKNLALQNIGLALLPRYLCKEELQSGRLIQVLSEYTVEGGAVHILTLQQRKASSKVKTFNNFLFEKLAPHFS